MLFALVFVCTRIFQLVTLIPTMGMLAWFINIFNGHNALTPDAIILFITSVLALAWAVFTLFSYHRSSANARFVALVDLAIFGALIAAVYQLRAIADADCSSNPRPSARWTVLLPVPDFGWDSAQPCAMLKACWAFAIINIILFFATALAAFGHGDHLNNNHSAEKISLRRHDRHYTTTTRHHGSHHGQRRGSHSTSSYHSGPIRSSHSHAHSHHVYV